VKLTTRRRASRSAALPTSARRAGPAEPAARVRGAAAGAAPGAGARWAGARWAAPAALVPGARAHASS